MASTTLNEVVLELQEQNRTLDDVKEGIKAMLTEDIMARKKEERSAGDRREAELEANRKKTSSDRPNVAPRSFTSGLSQGLGLDGILQGVSSFGGILGGASIGGLIGTALGRLFLPAAGAILGVNYLDKWIDPLVDKITGDDATWTIFGQEIDASKIVSGFAGALGVIFAKEALTSGMKKIFAGPAGVGYRKAFIRRLGVGGVILASGEAIGDYIASITGGEELGNAVSTAAQTGGLGLMLFGAKGLVIGALIGLGISAVSSMADWLKNKGDKMKKAAIDELDRKTKEVDAALEAGELEKAAKIAREGMSHDLYMQSLQMGAAGYMTELDTKYQAQREAFIDKALAAAEASGDTSLGAQASRQFADYLGDTNVTDKSVLMTAVKRMAQGEKISVQEALMQAMGESMSGLVSNDTSAVLASMITDMQGQLKTYEEYGKYRIQTPRIPVQRGDGLIDKVDVGARYTPNVMPKPGTAGFSLTDMFGSGNVFTNGTIQNVTIGTVDNSTNVVGGGKGSGNTSTDLGSSIDYYHLEKRLVGGTAMYANGTFNVRKY